LGIIRNNIVRFRIEHPEFDTLPIIVETETNSRFDGDVVQKFLTFERIFDRTEKNVGDIEFAKDVKLKRTGVIKTYSRTNSYVLNFNEALRFGKLKISDNVSTGNEKLSVKRILREAKDELVRFSWPDVDHDNNRYRKQRGPSGKMGGKNDDMSIAMQMLVHYTGIRQFERETLKRYVKTRWKKTRSKGKHSRYLENHIFNNYSHFML